MTIFWTLPGLEKVKHMWRLQPTVCMLRYILELLSA